MPWWANFAIIWTLLLFAAVTGHSLWVWAAFGWLVGYGVYLLVR